MPPRVAELLRRLRPLAAALTVPIGGVGVWLWPRPWAAALLGGVGALAGLVGRRETGRWWWLAGVALAGAAAPPALAMPAAVALALAATALAPWSGACWAATWAVAGWRYGQGPLLLGTTLLTAALLAGAAWRGRELGRWLALLARWRAAEERPRGWLVGADAGVERLTPEAVARREAIRREALEERLAAVVATVRRALGAYAAFLYLRTDDDALALAAVDAIVEGLAWQPRLAPEDGGLVSWVYRHSERFVALEYNRPVSGLTHHPEPPPVRSFLAVPVLDRMAVGVLGVEALERQAFAEEESRGVLEVAAAQVVQWLEVDGMRRELEEELEHWRAFFEVAQRFGAAASIAEATEAFLQAAELVTRADALFLVERVPEGGFVVRAAAGPSAELVDRERAFAPDESWAAWALTQPGARQITDLVRRRTPLPLLHVGERLPRSGSVLAVPFGGDEEGIGGGVVLWSRHANHFDAALTAVLERLTAPFRLAYGRARAMLELERLATTDGLTRLLNRRTGLERLAAELERVRRTGSPLAVALLDVDRFKSVNDTYGHPAGDAVLRAVAGALRAGVRTNDLVVRYGGEEFLVVMPDTDSQGALRLAERLRKRIGRLRVPIDGERTLTVTASFGVAATDAFPAEADPLLHAADVALYAAKERGRNRVVRARPQAGDAA